MPTVLSLSSQVARGYVGHSVNLFAWQRLGIDVIALPTILLSNRPDLAHWAGERVRPDLLDDMLGALQKGGCLSGVDAVFTGYMPSTAHVALAARLIERLKHENPKVIYCCDPIMGDDPDGLYVAEEAAVALRAELLPLADFLTPNRFELEWLAEKPVMTSTDAIDAIESLSACVLATKIPGHDEVSFVNLLADSTGAHLFSLDMRENVPHGTGDLIAALFLANLLKSYDPLGAAHLATAGVAAAIEASEGRDELDLIGSQEDWVNPVAWLYVAGSSDPS